MIKKLVLFILNIFDFFYQKKIIEFLSKNDLTNIDILIDVGAHKGESINLFLTNMNVKKIISFEPSPINFLKLQYIMNSKIELIMWIFPHDTNITINTIAHFIC